MADSIHKFEVEGLGKAPFRCIGFWEMPSKSLIEHNPEAWNNAIRSAPCSVGQCHYCHTPIINHFIIKSSDGRVFAVGSECVAKTGDKGLTTQAKLLKNKRARELREIKRERSRMANIFAEMKAWAGQTRYAAHEFNQRVISYRLEQEELQKRVPVIDLLEPLADRLEDGRNGFCDDIAEGLRKGNLPFGRGIAIMVDILAKQAGRRGSKAYNAEYDDVYETVHKAEDLLGIA